MSVFFEKCAAAGNGDFKNELCKIVEGLGTEFLRIIEDEIIRLKVIDTRLCSQASTRATATTSGRYQTADLPLQSAQTLNMQLL